MGYSKRNWTTRESKLLTEYYPTYGADASRWPEPIDRSVSAVSSYACKHGIMRRDLQYECIDKSQEDKLRESWYMVARVFKANPKMLLSDLNVMRKKGLL